MRSATHSTLSTLAAAALALTLAACSGSDEAVETEPTDAATASAAETTEAAESESTEAAESEAAPASGDLASCVLGSWVMSAEEAQAQALSNLGGLEADVTVEGTTRMEFKADSVTQVVDQSMALTAVIDESTTMESTTVTKGSLEASYTISGSTLTYGEVLAAEGGATVTMNQAGTESTQEIPFADTAASIAGVSYGLTCDDTTLEMSLEGMSAGVFTRE